MTLRRPASIRLEPFVASDPAQLAELERQRVLCGWGHPQISLWCAQTLRGDKAIYWMLPLDSSAFTLEDGALGAFRPLGHIALDCVDTDGDLELASLELGFVCLATFFVLKELQGRGLGGEAIRLLESLAAAPPFRARYLTLTTWSSVNTKNPDWWASIGRPWDPAEEYLHKEDWYARCGFVAWRVERRYPYTNRVTGESMLLDIVCMRKELK